MKNKQILSLRTLVMIVVSILTIPINVQAEIIKLEDNSLQKEYFNDYDPDCPEYENDGATDDYVIYIDKTINESSLFSCEDENYNVIYENDTASIGTTTLSKELATEINNANIGIYIEPNFIFDAMVEVKDDIQIENDLKRFEQINEVEKTDLSRDMRENWNIRMVHGDQESMSQKHAVVAVLDSGVDFMIDAPISKSVNLVTDEQNLTYYMTDMTGHGSAIADIINRMNPNAFIYSVRVLNKYNQAPLSRIIQGIRWCIDNDVDVINMSFGAFQNSKALQLIIEEATQKGIVFVAAAGNSGDRGVAYPASYEDVLSVGAINAQTQKTPDSAIGENVDLVAPGDDVNVQSMLGLYTSVGGTSIASAHVSGAASVLISQETENNANLVSNLLKKSAHFISSELGYGNGLLDLKYALASYSGYSQMREEAINQGRDVDSVSLTPNVEKLPIFSEEEVNAEALWKYGTDSEDKNRGHYFLAKVAIDYANTSENLTSISAPAARAFKSGAVAPDEYLMSHLHGAIQSNYITSYRLVTQIATKDGDTSSITHGVKGQSEEAFLGIKKQINLQGLMTGDKNAKKEPEKVGFITWENAIGTDYTGSDARKAKLRRIFIYGIALHSITDTFAHDAYVMDEKTNTIVRLEHDSDDGSPEWGADNAERYPNRFEDSKRAARCVIKAYNDNSVGGLFDFAPVDRNNERGYFLGELMTCARKANYGYTEDKLQSVFGKLTYDKTRLTVK